MGWAGVRRAVGELQPARPLGGGSPEGDADEGSRRASAWENTSWNAASTHASGRSLLQHRGDAAIHGALYARAADADPDASSGLHCGASDPAVDAAFPAYHRRR